MEVEVSKENICINKLVAEKKELVFINNDMIVPDSKPDILNTINVSGNSYIYKKEIMDDRVKIEGSINTFIMYLPDSKEDNIRALNCNLDFSQSFDIPSAREDMILITKCQVKDMECKVINGRKVNIKAGLEFSIKIYSNEDIEIINQINNVDDVQTLQENFEVNSLVGNGKTSVYGKDTFNIPTEDELAEILKVDINLGDKDIKLSYNKVLAKLEAEIKIMYLTEDNRIGRVEGKIPVVGFIDIQNVSEDNICDVNYEIKNMQIKPNAADEHSIYVEIEVEQICMAFEKKQINLIQDLYSPSKNLEFSQKRISSSSNKIETSKEFTVKDRVKVASLEDGNLLDVEITPNILNTKISSSKIIYSGEIGLNFIFTRANTVNCRNSKIPLEIAVDNNNRTENINEDIDIAVANSTFNIQSGEEVDCEIDLETSVKTSKNVSMNIIDNIEIIDDENKAADDDYDSLILYIVQPNDTLWLIAKKFNSTVDEIARMNGIQEADKINIGQKIYIPKFNYIKKEETVNAAEQTFV